jgi:hypothetical protein
MAEMIVRYKGAADTRIMAADELKLHDVNVPEDLVFSRSNLWRIKMEVPDALEAILRMDGAFRLEAVNDAGMAGETVVDGTRTDDTGATVVDGSTGQRSKKPEGDGK